METGKEGSAGGPVGPNAREPPVPRQIRQLCNSGQCDLRPTDGNWEAAFLGWAVSRDPRQTSRQAQLLPLLGGRAGTETVEGSLTRAIGSFHTHEGEGPLAVARHRDSLL